MLLTLNSCMTTYKRTSFDWEGHRGARGLLPENTIMAFQKAIDLGVNTLEMDVVVSKDNILVVSHEPWFSSEISSFPDGRPVTSDIEKSLKIYQMSYDSVKMFDVGKRGHPRFSQQKATPAYKPAIEEVLTQCDEYAKKKGKPLPKYNIEIKTEPSYYGVYTPHPEEFVNLLYSVLHNYNILGRCTIQSFDLAPLEVLHQLDSSIVVSYLVENSDSPEKNLSKLTFKPDIYSPNFILINKKNIDYLHANKIKVIPWTVNDLDNMKRLVKLNVDGIITDYPNLIFEVKN